MKKADNEGKIKLQFLGANNRVTGASTLITFPHGLKVLVDYGLVQDSTISYEKLYEINSRDFEFTPEEIDYVILTHFHIDHTGLIPKLTKRSDFKGNIITTQATADMSSLVLTDAAFIMENEIERYNRKAVKKLQPIYSMEDAKDSIGYMRCYDFNREIMLDDKVKLILRKAGHVLGASSPLFIYKEDGQEKKILITGDTSGIPRKRTHPFVPEVDSLNDINKIDCLITEATYGNRLHDYSIKPTETLKECIRETCVDRGKTLLIPSFSAQRSSELLWLLREIYLENEEFNKIPIYLDSPLACQAQRVMDNNREYWDNETLERDKKLGDIFKWDKINYISDVKDSRTLANGERKIIISASGMCNAGRVLHHLISFLPGKGCCVLFCGYQGEGTLGHKILFGKEKAVMINGQHVPVRAQIRQMEFSSHGDYIELINWFKTSNRGAISKILIHHGDREVMSFLKEELEKHLNVEVLIPQYRETVKI